MGSPTTVGSSCIASGARCGRHGSGGCLNRSYSSAHQCLMAALKNGPLKDARSNAGRPQGYSRGTFTATPLPGFFVDKHTLLSARNDPRVVVINALSPPIP